MAPGISTTQYDIKEGGRVEERTPSTKTGIGSSGSQPIGGELQLDGRSVNLEDYRPKTSTAP